jgi:hypothetical protein
LPSKTPEYAPAATFSKPPPTNEPVPLPEQDGTLDVLRVPLRGARAAASPPPAGIAAATFVPLEPPPAQPLANAPHRHDKITVLATNRRRIIASLERSGAGPY